MHASPAEFCLLGDAFGALAGVLTPAGVDDGADAQDITDAVDRQRGTLGDDERLVFVLGYEACVGLDPRAHRLPHARELGPPSLLRRLRCGPLPLTPRGPPPTLQLTTTMQAKRAHLERVERCREALRDGVVYQANLAHRCVVGPVVREAALRFFLAHRGRAACAAYLDVAGWGSIVSLSPERFVQATLDGPLDERRAWTWPIKGTVLGHRDADIDAAAVQRLRASEKDRAEHVMIVDLLRNDLGRLAVVGGVQVTSLMHVVSTASVHHLESTIEARLRPDVGVAEVIRATAPGGSITGAPKSAAVDLIASLEAGPRGAYTGVLGVVDRLGRLQTSLLIRTWLRPDDGAGSLHVGGGIVVDSDPESEWQETLHKAAAFGQVVVEP
jgi:para-aminobenzoate synthetase component I